MRLRPAEAVLLVVDFQERLAAAMPASERAACERNVGILIELARRLAIPVVVSEQYPKGLGPTTAALASAVGAPGLALHRMEKMSFACTDAPSFEPLLAGLARRQWIVCGMEAHVCVYQTVRGLCARGLEVQLPADAVISRTAANLAVGLDLARRAGALVTSTETVVFDALGVAGTDDFRALSKLIK